MLRFVPLLNAVVQPKS